MMLSELLRLRGIDPRTHKIKVVRHQDSRVDLRKFSRKELEIYQSHQDHPIFDGVDYVVSFIGAERGLARMLGVYRVNTPKGVRPPKLAISNRALKRTTNTRYYYDLRRDTRFKDWEERVVIKWTGAYVQWQQWLPPDKPVVQVLPKGRREPFHQYSDVLLSFDDLSRIVANPDANADWHTALSSTAGVYLIVDKRSGRLYVGSASGERGILGRWAQYARNGHGGNDKLKHLLAQHPNRQKHFQYCILQTLSRSWSRREVIAVEQAFKQKLGKLACSLNTN
jgi:hypothetical protein